MNSPLVEVPGGVHVNKCKIHTQQWICTCGTDQVQERVEQRPIKIHWKEKVRKWKCLCVWHAAHIQDKAAQSWIRRIAVGAGLDGFNDMVVRGFTQSDKKRRFEVFLQLEEDCKRLKDAINGARGWHCKIGIPVESRIVKQRDERKRAHSGRFSVMSWNADSLGNKFGIAKIMVEKTRPTVIAVQETMRRRRSWQQDDQVFRLGRYVGEETKIDADGTGKRERGLAIAVDTRANLRLERVITGVEGGTMIFARISGFKGGGSVIIGNIYLPNQKQGQEWRRIGDAMRILEQDRPNEEIVLVGDWNTRRKSMMDKLYKKLGFERMRLVDVKNPLSYTVNGIAKSDIDHAVISSGIPPPKGRILRRWTISDHWPLVIQWKRSAIFQMLEPGTKPERMVASKINSNKMTIATHNRFAELAELAKEGQDESLYVRMAAEAKVIARELKCMSGGREDDNQAKRRPSEHAYMTHKERKKERRLRSLLRKHKATKDSKKKVSLYKKIRKLREKVTKYLNKAARAARWHFHRAFQDARVNNDPSAVHEYIRRAAGTFGARGTTNMPIKDADGRLVTEPAEKADIWAKIFADQAKDITGRSKDRQHWLKYHTENVRRLVEERFADGSFEAEPRHHLSMVRQEVHWNTTEDYIDYSPRVDVRIRDTWEDTRTDTEKADEVCRRRMVLKNLNVHFTMTEIREFLKDAGRRKSPGVDGVTNELLRCIGTSREDFAGDEAGVGGRDKRNPLAVIIHKIVERAWSKAEVKREWDSAVVVPVPKKGDLTDPNNYRGIALLNTTFKLINGMLADRLSKTIVDYRLLDPAQVGFLNREEAVAQAATLMHICQRRQLKGQDTVLCFVDLAKAYDSVPHEGLLMKLERFGVHGEAMNWLRAIYKNPKICCRKSDGGYSKSMEYERGVRQGDPISPILFDIFMDDLLSKEFHDQGITVDVHMDRRKTVGGTKLAALLYADDIVLMADNLKEMTILLGKLSRWCDENDMKVNATKCGILKVRAVNGERAQRATEFSDATEEDEEDVVMSLQGQEIAKVTSYTYLGVEIDANLDRELMVRKRIEVCKASVLRYSKLLRSPLVPLEAKAICVKAHIMPTLTYGSEIFGFSAHRVAKAESEIMRAVRTCLRLPTSTSMHIMRNEFKMRSIHEIACVARTRIEFKRQVLGGWYPRVVSGPVVKSRANRLKQLWSQVSERWRNRVKVTETIEKRVKELEKKLEELRNHKKRNKQEIAKVVLQIRNVVPDTIRLIMRQACRKGPNKDSVLEVRYGSDNGAANTRDLVWQCMSQYTELAYGFTVLVRIRMGRYWTSPKLVRARLIDEVHLASCPFCGVGEEDEAHIIFKCPEWQQQRSRTLLEGVAKRGHRRRTRLETLGWTVVRLTGIDHRCTEWCADDTIVPKIVGPGQEKSVEDILIRLVTFLAAVSPRRFRQLPFRKEDCLLDERP